LGLPGAVSPMKGCIADPEALLIAAVDLGRYDPRLLAVRRVHPARLASWIGAASRTVSEAMREMGAAGILRGAARGRLVEYALQDREHWAAIAKVEGEAPPWIDWPPLLFAACDLARLLEEPRFAEASPGVQDSLVADAWSALSVPLRDSAGAPIGFLRAPR